MSSQRNNDPNVLLALDPAEVVFEALAMDDHQNVLDDVHDFALCLKERVKQLKRRSRRVPDQGQRILPLKPSGNNDPSILLNLNPGYVALQASQNPTVLNQVLRFSRDLLKCSSLAIQNVREPEPTVKEEETDEGENSGQEEASGQQETTSGRAALPETVHSNGGTPRRVNDRPGNDVIELSTDDEDDEEDKKPAAVPNGSKRSRSGNEGEEASTNSSTKRARVATTGREQPMAETVAAAPRTSDRSKADGSSCVRHFRVATAGPLQGTVAAALSTSDRSNANGTVQVGLAPSNDDPPPKPGTMAASTLKHSTIGCSRGELNGHLSELRLSKFGSNPVAKSGSGEISQLLLEYDPNVLPEDESKHLKWFIASSRYISMAECLKPEEQAQVPIPIFWTEPYYPTLSLKRQQKSTVAKEFFYVGHFQCVSFQQQAGRVNDTVYKAKLEFKFVRFDEDLARKLDSLGSK